MRGRQFSGRNAVLVLLGAVLVVAAIRGFLWYSVDPSGPNVAGDGFTFDDLRANASSLEAAVSHAFFDWLAWTLLITGGLAALGATIPSPACDVLRVAAFLLGLTGAIATYYAVAQLYYAQRAAGGTGEGVLHNASYGLWSCLAGFALIAIGGGLGARGSDTITS